MVNTHSAQLSATADRVIELVRPHTACGLPLTDEDATFDRLAVRQPVWIECKSGDHYGDQLAKYGTLASTIGIGPARNILAVHRIDADQARLLGLIHGDLAPVLAAASAPGAR